MQLHDEYRPKSWTEVVAQERVLARIDQLRRRGLAGRPYWITGASGSGMSTIARLLAAEVADDWAIEEVDAQWLTPARIADIERQSNTKPLGGRGWVYIANESHALSTPAVRQLLVTLERLPPWSTWIFSTTAEGQESFEGGADAAPLLSRCILLALARRGLAEPFAVRAQTIARAEGLDGKPLESYIRLAQQCKNNLRAMLCAVESGTMAEVAECAK